MVNDDQITKARIVPTREDHRTAVRGKDGLAKVSAYIDSGMSAPEFLGDVIRVDWPDEVAGSNVDQRARIKAGRVPSLPADHHRSRSLPEDRTLSIRDDDLLAQR